MDYYPANTIDQPIASQPNNETLAVYAGNSWQWVSPRNIALISGATVMLIIGAIAMRSTAIPEQSIKIAPLVSDTPSSKAVNQVILENSKASLDEIKTATDLKIDEVTMAMLNERSQEIGNEAKRQLADAKSPCFRSPHQKACFISTFIPEQQLRYEDAVLARKWAIANQALFDIKAARVALDGTIAVAFTPNITSAAIIKEMETRVNILKQSDNAIAADLYGGK